MTAQGEKHVRLAHNSSRHNMNITKATRITGKSKMMITGGIGRATIQGPERSGVEREESQAATVGGDMRQTLRSN